MIDSIATVLTEREAHQCDARTGELPALMKLMKISNFGTGSANHRAHYTATEKVGLLLLDSCHHAARHLSHFGPGKVYPFDLPAAQQVTSCGG